MRLNYLYLLETRVMISGMLVGFCILIILRKHYHGNRFLLDIHKGSYFFKKRIELCFKLFDIYCCE